MKKIGFLCIMLMTFSCTVKDNFVEQYPEPANLVFPENNQECNQGVPVPGTNYTNVTFNWEDDTNAVSYTLAVKNLSTQTESIYISNTNKLTVGIDKATPYSWYIISHNLYNLDTVQSEIWKFYNAGDPVTSYIPFPADAVYPKMSGVYSGLSSVQLEWNGLDIDNDIVNYDVFFDTVRPLTTLIGNTTQNIMETVVSSGNVYYWRIVTNDSAGNNSQSEVFEFRVE